MGKSQSKEEIIIAQTGNNGTGANLSFGHMDLGIAVLVSIIIVIIIVWAYRRWRKNLSKAIRKEITRSTANL